MGEREGERIGKGPRAGTRTRNFSEPTALYVKKIVAERVQGPFNGQALGLKCGAFCLSGIVFVSTNFGISQY